MQRTSFCGLLTHTSGELTFVRLTGERVDLDEAGAFKLRDRLLALVEAGRRRLTLDLGNVGFLTSTMVETLLCLHRRLKALGGGLSVCNPTPGVAEIFAVLKLESVIEIHTDPPNDLLAN
jgi:anti-sigma B factor antagonist